jgi:hypothetical protein
LSYGASRATAIIAGSLSSIFARRTKSKVTKKGINEKGRG